MNNFDYLSYGEEVLRLNEYRITAPRIEILKVLKRAKSTLKAYEIAEKCTKKGISVDTSTVYRVLEVFKELGLVHFIKEKQGYVACRELSCSNKNHCHHQFVCKKCDSVEEIHFNDKKFIAEIKKSFRKLLFEGHYFEFMGICQKCRAKAK